MRALSAADLLDAWEQGQAVPAQRAAIALLEVAGDGREDPRALIDLPVGERDRRLIELREDLFGSTVSAALTCGSCGESLELTFDTASIRVLPADPTATTVTAVLNGRELAFRLPTTRDLLALSSGDVAEARRQLVQRCAIVDDVELMEALAEADLEAIGSAMEAADPQADVQLESICTACASPVSATFDIFEQLRAELDAWAKRTLHEVASLAVCYGWAEQDILAMSAWRRQAYLRAAGG